jgi:hypothetical protein
MSGDDAEKKRRQRLLRLARQVRRDRAATKAHDWSASPAFQKFQAEWKQMTESPAWRRLAEDAKSTAESPAFRREREIYELLAEAERLEREESKTSAPEAAEAEAPTLKKASKQMIRTEVKRLYDEADTRKEKPPNINELPVVVQNALAAKNYRATKTLIKEIGREFKDRRGQVGRRWS